jgi:hypothetical protein
LDPHGGRNIAHGRAVSAFDPTDMRTIAGVYLSCFSR